MAWVKKNLLFVVAIAIAVLLIGGGAYYAYSASNASAQAAEELQAKSQAFDTLIKSDPFPNPDNIKRAKAEEKRVAEFKNDARARFGSVKEARGLDTGSFKSLLEGTIASLERDANHAGVQLPEKFSFTFSQQRKDLQMQEKTLAPMSGQLADITEICHILYQSKIHSLLYLKRAPLGTNAVDPAYAQEFLAKKIVPEPSTGAIRYPYEVSFQCFSGEFAAVLAGFRDASDAFVVKTVNVERGQTGNAVTAGIAVQPAYDPYARYRNRPGFGGVPAPAPARKSDEPVLEPKPVRFTLGLEIIKLPATSKIPATAERSAR